MKLKQTYPTQAEIPAEHQRLYTERDGAWVLNVEIEPPINPPAAAAHSQLEKQLAAAAAERDSLRDRLAAIQIEQSVLAAASQRGLRPAAIPDITARARGAFRLVDGSWRALAGDGGASLTPAEWVETQAAEAPHLFGAFAGSGAAGGNASAFGEPNPWKRESFNLTRQGEIARKDPARARQLRQAANL